VRIADTSLQYVINLWPKRLNSADFTDSTGRLGMVLPLNLTGAWGRMRRQAVPVTLPDLRALMAVLEAARVTDEDAIRSK
jgi:hypothetical protein